MSELHELVAAIHAEIDGLSKEFDAVEPLLTKLTFQEPDPIELRAVATTLHAFYSGLERVLIRIAKQFDHKVPSGGSWHQQLLTQMVSQTDGRGSVITDSLRERLSDYLGFRHLYRHAYPTTLKWKRVKPLVQSLHDTHQEFLSNINRFLAEVESPGRPDPSSP